MSLADEWAKNVGEKKPSGESLEEQAKNIVIHTLNEIQGVENKEEQALYSLAIHCAMTGNFLKEKDLVEEFDEYAIKVTDRYLE